MTPEQLARQSKALLEDPVFVAAFAEVRRRQVDIFNDPNAKPEALAEAHNMVRALHAIETQIRRGVVDVKFPKRAAKKGQHRASD